MDPRDFRPYGRAAKGTPVIAKVSGKRQKRVNVLGALVNGKLVGSIRTIGSVNKEIFNMWLKESLIPLLEKGMTIIMDNASFHKGKETREIIENAGLKLKFLPPYSPDFNPIEQTWHQLKAARRSVGRSTEKFRFSVFQAIQKIEDY